MADLRTQEKFLVRFWGVRGSIASPGKDTVKYGGNTVCVEVRAGQELLIFDGGTGIRNLGKALVSQSPFSASVFLSHLHWDHIQGLPFFEPAFIKGNTLTFYGGKGANGMSLRDCLVTQMRDPHFPVPMTEMSADLRFCELDSGTVVNLSDVQVRAAALNHPGGCLGYRIEWRQKSIAYVTDTEHPKTGLDNSVMALASGSHLLIYDATYTDEEYLTGKEGWGHSTWQCAVKIAIAAGTKRLVLFHHDPSHTDSFLDEVGQCAEKLFPNVLIAREGMTIDLLTNTVTFQ